jgi:serine/threonine protein kinase
LALYADGASPEHATITTHLDVCEDCRLVVSTLIKADSDNDHSEHLGRFRVDGILGSGAMGVVYAAFDPTLHRSVALKVLHGEATDNELLKEARALAQQSHPNVITVYEVGTVDEQIFLAMELVEGTTLRQWCDASKRPWHEVVAVFIDAGRGLAAAHAGGLVHRDFKPDNVLISKEGRVLVTDFGLATVSAAPPEDTTSAVTEALVSGAGQLTGTPAYMSPEQFQGVAVTAASDQFSFAIALFEALYGVRPFTGKTLLELSKQVLEGDVSLPRDIDSPVPLLRLIQRALATEPGLRFESMNELLTELESILSTASRGNQRRPFVGLSALREGDSGFFFGRHREIREAETRLESSTLLVVVGPSGVGKSSFVHAALLPRLTSEGWQCLSLRPSREPLANLADLIQRFDGTRNSAVREALADKLRREPDFLARTLLTRAESFRERTVVVIDQLEELFTLGADPKERLLFAEALLELCKEPTRGLRLVMTIRSDLLDRVGEHRELLRRVSKSLLFLPQPDRELLSSALTGPVQALGYHFESRDVVDQIVDDLEGHPGSLPLLQFVGDQLWDARDEANLCVTGASYAALGAVAGFLARHADKVVSELSPSQRTLAQSIFRRLVTGDGTRNVVSVRELEELGDEAGVAKAVLDHLVKGRLLVVSEVTTAGNATVELAHESLISAWPQLRQWLDAHKEGAVFLAELRVAAQQWHKRQRRPGLLWRGEAAAEARYWRSRFEEPMSAVEVEFLDAVESTARRSLRVRRALVSMSLLVTTAVAAAALVALLRIQSADSRAEQEARQARIEANNAQVAERSAREAEKKARTAEKEAKRAQVTVTEQLRALQAEKNARALAEAEAGKATQAIAAKDVELRKKNVELKNALGEAKKLTVRLQETLARERKEAKERERQLRLRVSKLK